MVTAPVDVTPDEPLTTKEGWWHWTNNATIPPLLRPEWKYLPSVSKATYNEARLDYHGELIVVDTPIIKQVINTARRHLILNRNQQVSARRGLIITGGAGTGKTTAITQLGRAHELAFRRRITAPGTYIPVVYITVPPAATPRMIAVEFARFLGIPVTRSANITDITDTVCGVLSDARCDLVLVDEVHNLNLATRTGAEVSDQLKYFAERIRATFVYAGIDLDSVGLFSGVRGRQIASRFTPIHAQPFAFGSQQQRTTWQSLITVMEAALRLHHHRPGTLAKQAEYLYRRTAGMIGSLSHLIRGAAIDAICDGTEKITKQHLESVPLDHHARTAPLPNKKTRPKR